MTIVALTSVNETVNGTSSDDLITGTSSTASSGTWQRSGDQINGGGGTDTFQVTILDASSATIHDADLQKLQDIETMTLLGGFGANVTLGAISDAEGLTELNGAGMAGNMTVNASGRWNDIVIDASKGTDTLTGGMGNDTFRFTSATFNSLDTVKGGGFGDTNTIEITDKAALLDSAFTHVSDVQRITLTGSNINATGQKVTLGALSVAAGITEVDVLDNQAATLDASARTKGVTFRGGSGNDVFIATGQHNASDRFYGGGGNDSYQVKEDNFGNSIVDGGGGTDEIRIIDSPTLPNGQPIIEITDQDFEAITSVEQLVFNAAGRQTVTLGANASFSGLTTIDASKMTTNLHLELDNNFTNQLTIDLGSGSATFILGNGSNHEIVTTSGHMTAVYHITGNTNNLDQIHLTDAVHLADLYFKPLTQIAHIGALYLDNSAAGQTFTAGANFANFVTQASLFQIVASSASTTASMTYDFSNYTGPALAVYGTGGSDTFIAGSVDMAFYGAASAAQQGVADTFKFKSAQLNGADLVHGASSFDDKLVLLDDTTAIVDADFQNVVNVEVLKLAAALTGTYTLTLGTKFGDNGFQEIDASLAGVNVVIDAHSVTSSETVLAGSKNNFIELGSGSDTVSINPTTTTFADIISGGVGGGSDMLKLTAGGTITAANLANISGFESVKFSDLGNNLTLTSDFITSAESGLGSYDIDGTSVSDPLLIITGKGNDVVDESQGDGSVAILGSAGTDKYIGSASGDEFFFTKPTDITSLTSIDGGAGYDSVTLDAGTYTAAQFLNFKNIEELDFSDADHTKAINLTLNNTLFSTAQGHSLFADFSDQTGGVFLDTTAVTDAAANLTAWMGQQSIVTVKGGAENDTVEFSSTSSTALNGLPKIDGGSGHNTLELIDTFSGTASFAPAALTNVRNMQTLMLGGGANTTFDLTLDDHYQAAGFYEIDASLLLKGLDLNGFAYQTGLTVDASLGNDNLILTNRDDTVVFKAGGFLASTLDSNDTINGVNIGGRDVLEFIGNTTLVDADFTNVTSMPDVDFVNGAFSITLGTHTDAATVSTIDASRAGQGGDILGAAATANLKLTGSNQADIIAGGSGSDTITGGRGGDTLTGNGSGDTFMYLSAADSYQMGSDLSHADTILDFGSGDHIKLSGLVGAISAVTNQGSGSSFTTTDIANFFFDGAATNSVAVAYNSVTNNTRIYVDTDKNGSLDLAHDMVITVAGNHLAALASSSSYA